MNNRTIKITLLVDAGAAVRALSSCAGPQELRLTPEDLATLSEVERETLARHLERQPAWGEPLHLGCEPLARADLNTLRECLRVRAYAIALATRFAANPIDYIRGGPTGAGELSAPPWLSMRANKPQGST